MIKTHWKMALALALALAAGAVFSSCSLGRRRSVGTKMQTVVAPSGKVGAALGDTAPDFQLTQMDGTPVTLSGLRGQPAVLIFWTAWCPACKEEAPHFNELAAKYDPRGVRVLGINIQDSLARTEGGMREFGIRYPVARDADASVARRYQVAGTPTIVFLDRQGVVHYFGHELPPDYPQRLEALLAEKG